MQWLEPENHVSSFGFGETRAVPSTVLRRLAGIRQKGRCSIVASGYVAVAALATDFVHCLHARFSKKHGLQRAGRSQNFPELGVLMDRAATNQQLPIPLNNVGTSGFGVVCSTRLGFYSHPFFPGRRVAFSKFVRCYSHHDDEESLLKKRN
jgi:hypothetical protein